MTYKRVRQSLDAAEDTDNLDREWSLIEGAITQLEGMKDDIETLQDTDIDDVRDRVEPFIAEPHSDEGQEIIHNDSTHVLEVWEDGELTSTKSGDLYRARSLHQSSPPVWPEGSEVLFDTGDQDHKRMVVIDRDALEEILDEYR